MRNSSEIMNSSNLSPLTLQRIARKKTEAGRIKELSTLRAFREIYGNSENVFLLMMDAMRNKAGNLCPCGCQIHAYYKRVPRSNYKYRCAGCRRVVSPLASTPLRKNKVPLNQTLELAYYMFQGKNLTAREAMRIFGWKYETALNQTHRVREWIGLTVGQYEFDPFKPVQCDEVWVPIPTGLGATSGFSRSRGLKAEGRKPVVIMGQKHGLYKPYTVDYVNTSTIRPLFTEVPTTCPIWTDGHKAYNFLRKDNFIHSECNHGSKPKVWVNPDTSANVNSIEAVNGRVKLKVTLHRGMSEEYLQKYVDEICWIVSNNRKGVLEAIHGLFQALPALNSDVSVHKSPNVN